MRKTLLLGAIVLSGVMLSGCTITSLADDPADSCMASKYQYLVGLGSNVLDTTLMPGNTRIIRPSDLVTQDYSASRINVTIDDFDYILRVYCG